MNCSLNLTAAVLLSQELSTPALNIPSNERMNEQKSLAWRSSVSLVSNVFGCVQAYQSSLDMLGNVCSNDKIRCRTEGRSGVGWGPTLVNNRWGSSMIMDDHRQSLVVVDDRQRSSTIIFQRKLPQQPFWPHSHSLSKQRNERKE